MEAIVRSTGFFRDKARSLMGMANAVTTGSVVRSRPRWRTWTTIPGVGRKTANVSAASHSTCPVYRSTPTSDGSPAASV